MLTALYTTIYMYNYKTCFEHINCQYLTNKILLKINYVNLHDPPNLTTIHDFVV